MKENRDQELRDKLNQAGLEDFMPDFNIEEEWRKLEHKVQAPVPLFQRSRKYWPYAAIFILGCLLSFWIGQGEERSHTIVTAAIRNKTGTVPNGKEDRQEAILMRSKDTFIKSKAIVYDGAETQTPARDTTVQPVAISKTVTDTMQQKEPEQAIAAVPEALPVRHYLDVMGTAPEPEEQLTVAKKKRSLRSRLTRNREIPYAQPKEQLPIRGFLYALNQ